MARHKRTKKEMNCEDKTKIIIPGMSVFNNGFFHEWLSRSNARINVALFYKKVLRWYGDGSNLVLRKDFSRNDKKDYKKDHLEFIVNLSKKSLKNYENIKKRYYFNGLDTFVLTSKTRLLVGFAGGDTVLENSISLHPYYGFPVIPGSSLKGLTRHYCDEFEDMDKNMVLRIFGNESGDKDAREGEVIFMDSWPEEWPAKGFLELDVMSPHFTGYYDKKSFPTDSSQPVPILFLAVRRGVRFRFAVLPSRACRDTSIVGLAKCCLEKALKTFGAGAKTGSSYGYFE